MLPALYIMGASVVMVVLLFYRTQTTWPGLLIVLAGVPVYFWWRPEGGRGIERLPPSPGAMVDKEG